MSGIMESVDTKLSPQSTNPLKDKVFHADIRIESIEDCSKNEQADQVTTLVEHNSQDATDRETQEKAAEMQVWWDEAIARYMGLNDGYEKVAVLLIKWDDGLDELKTREETEELRSLFADRFHYHCEVIELNVLTKPQHQMNRYLSAFVDKHDGPNNLMIVYYTGHGVYREDHKYLELTASTDPYQKRGFKNEARANWDRAEDHLRSDYVEGDVLAILDTCYSSNLQKSGKEDTRTFEVLSACGLDATTASPGPQSFTRALIDALKELLIEYHDRSFTTFHLNQRILLHPNRRDTASQLWHRLKHHERHIRLAPLKPQNLQPQRTPSFFNPPRGYLTLRFALRDDSLNREQIEYLTRNLCGAFKNKAILGLRRIDWMGLKPARTTHFGRAALAMFAIAQWKKVVARKRMGKCISKEGMHEMEVEGAGATAPSASDVSFPSSSSTSNLQLHSQCESPTRKRNREPDDQGNEENLLPEPKKGFLVVAPPQKGEGPPSPPISDSSSRME